ncbi:MAG TPA: sn-glycerol-3-phosphate ABC transporter substrate-binding protein UgpB [Candidatus Methylomirabilis sp.]|nr:sn-glycerol-3-phosphate ABC transporter substrate-binding protein UgpB [Candidatus Methylomirabilis sp.]
MLLRLRCQKIAVLVAGIALAIGLGPSPSEAQQRVQVEFWHGLPQPEGGMLEKVVSDFNASQTKYEVKATFKGSYPETMVAAIAAFRAGTAPHIVQMFEVGTATMMAAKGAIRPVYELMREAGVAFNPKTYVPAVRSYYSTSDGRMLSMPFNSSTPITWYNKDAFKKAGLDPNKPPRTWEETRDAAKKIRAANAAACGFATSWPTWTQFENFSAIHNVPLATKSNGMDGLDAELKINSPIHVKHVQTLIDMMKEGTFKYGGRDGAGNSLFTSGECAIIHASSGMRARVVSEAKFDYGVAMLPYYKGTSGAPKNSIIGGASFWVMTGPKRTPDEYKAVAEFFGYLARPEVDAKWHIDTGYVPITMAGFALVSGQGYYIKNPGTDLPFRQLTLTEPTENSRGLRLGNMPEIRVIMQEEMEKALQGQQTAKQALDNTVQRGNVVLRNFERANKQ